MDVIGFVGMEVTKHPYIGEIMLAFLLRLDCCYMNITFGLWFDGGEMDGVVSLREIQYLMVVGSSRTQHQDIFSQRPRSFPHY